jgi:hypothetical protein
MTFKRSLVLAFALSLAPAAVNAQHGGPSHPDPAKNPYGPYAFLVGAWDVVPESGGAPFGVTRFKWGPNRSYLWFSMAMLEGGKEVPHFEGLLVWNGMKKKLDMLLTVDLANGLTQEQGLLSVAEDGTVVRDITMISGEAGAGAGKSMHFRQTFKAAGTDRVLTNAMRETEKGWVPTFPGSDHLALTRRADPL